jgi:hypothetical protein
MVAFYMYRYKGKPGVELKVRMGRLVTVAGMGLVLATCTQIQESMLSSVENPVAVHVTMLGFPNAAAGRDRVSVLAASLGSLANDLSTGSFCLKCKYSKLLI